MRSAVLLMTFLLSSSLALSARRIKRVYNGQPVVGRSMGYAAVNYFGAVTTMHWSFSLFTIFTSQPDVECGAALITPKLVQTACHCVATFPTSDDFVGPPTVNHHWETVKVVYIGVNKQYGDVDSMQTVNPLTSRKFIVHQKCGRLKPNTIITHDYAWIVTFAKRWSEGDPDRMIPTAGIEYAPQYPVRELTAIWNYNLQSQAVCLTIGHGPVDTDNPASSDLLRHGWSAIVDQSWCRSDSAIGIPYENVSDYMNWFCAEEFPRHDQLTMKGDSGGPIACNNYYFGVVQGGSFNKKQKPIIDVYSGIVFSVFENAAEYRRRFIEVVDDLDKVTYTEFVKKEFPDGQLTFKPTNKLFAHSGSLSFPSSPSKPAYLHFFSLAVAIFKCKGLFV